MPKRKKKVLQQTNHKYCPTNPILSKDCRCEDCKRGR